MINYYLITKPGIVLGNLVTLAAGFLLATTGSIDYTLFFITLFGLSFVMASSCIFNNDINRESDKKMDRTKNRPLATGAISRANALLFATVLGIFGFLILFIFTNTLTAMVAGVGFFVYVVIYSYWKCRTIYGTAIGSVAGAIPPIVGYAAVSNRLDLGAFILFSILVLWQMPHFFSIAIYHFDDYKKADIPVLPIKRGMLKTKIHMVLYILAFILACASLTFFKFTGNFYLSFTTLIGLSWLMLCIKGFKVENEQLWGKQMFFLSLVAIIGLCIIIPLDLVK